MTAIIIDGRATAEKLLQELALQAKYMSEKRGGIVPGLAVILVGEDPASQVYVRNKNRVCEEVGFRSYAHVLPANTEETDLIRLIDELNKNPEVNGILVQLPLPKHIDESAIISAIDPLKDVDGFHPLNIGHSCAGLVALRPCTPTGCMILIQQVVPDLSGKKALVVGRSNIVGKPMSMMLLEANCTVTTAHSRTKDLAAECAQADILVAAVGRPEFIQGDWIKEGAIVIDVGVNRINKEGSIGTKLVGDVAFKGACERAAAITPVPGGVGPMTIACLMQNTMKATMLQNGWD